MHSLEKNVKLQIEEMGLLEPAEQVLVALSGGADSVALLVCLLRLGYQCEAVHCNFHLRSEESNRDEQFCRTLCEKLKVKLHFAEFATLEYAKLHKESIEMSARRLRYEFFETVRKQLGIKSICVAHHQNDNIETLLLNLLRGSGIHGLRGMKPRNGYIVRPFLKIWRKDILDYLAQLGQDFVEDSSNAKTDVLRNSIRHELLPMMCKLNISAELAIARTMDHLSEVEIFYNDAIQEEIKRLSEINPNGVYEIKKDLLKKCANPHLVLYEMLNSYGFKETQLSNIIKGLDRVGTIYTTSSHELLVDRECLLVRELNESECSLTVIDSCGSYPIENGFLIIEEIRNFDQFPADLNSVIADAEKLTFPLILRRVREGDRFQPLGMKGFKLVSDFLTNKKLNRFEKNKQMVLTSNDQIIWLVGQRIDQRVAINRETTQRFLKITLVR